MEIITNKTLSKKIKNSKFAKFVKNHRKTSIFSVCLIAILVVIIIPNINNKGYQGDFSYARNQAISETNNDIYFKKEATLTSSISESYLGSSIEYSVDLPISGKYALYADYTIISDGFQDSEFDIEINGNLQLSRGKCRAFWKNESEIFKLDSFNNEISPNQVVIPDVLYQGIYDYEYLSVLPYRFSFNSGLNKILFTQTGGKEIKINALYVVKEGKIESYDKYISAYSNKDAGTRIEDIQSEHFSSKNDTTPIAGSTSDINAYPYKTVESVLNIVTSFSKAEQLINYSFEIEKEGLYVFNFNSFVNNSNHVSFATIFVDGSIPFTELMHYPFIPTNNFSEHVLKSENNVPYQIYLSEGQHTLTIKIDQSLYKETLSKIKNSIETLNSIYLALKRIAGTVSNNNQQWDPDTDFPGILPRIQNVYEQLIAIKPDLYLINGSDSNYQSVINLNSAISSLKGILEKPKYIPNQYTKFSEGSGSIIENLALIQSDLTSTPIDIDRIIIGTISDYNLKNKKSSFYSFGEKVKKFFLSFTYDYTGKTNDKKTLDIWVARSRQYVDLMQELIDASDFEVQTGYKVKFQILSDESKLILSNAAKISPDGVMGISNWLPYEMGIRELTVDLTSFDDYGEVISRFSPGAMISLIADKKGLALPETQDFYVTYYRKDIFNEYNFSVPNTWDDVITLLPALQRNGFNYYIPLSSSTSSKSIMSTAPFIYQYGGNLFSDDGLTTTIDEENSLNAIKMMTELFTNYGLETQVANFFDSFRNGSLPIGVSTFDMYVKLMISAPELSNKWGITLSPGIQQEDSSIARWQTGSAQSMCLIDKGEERNNAGWELLKWWSSTEVQTEFAKRLTIRYGKGYIWNSANLAAFNNSLIFSNQEKQIILNQWEYMREIPRVPGWYMLERELSNGWNKIVLNGMNTRAVIEDAVDVINKELTRKLVEFGYLDNKGNSIKPYTVTTLSLIEEMMKGGH